MGTVATAVTYVGIALVAVTALPVVDGRQPLAGDYMTRRCSAVVATYDPTLARATSCATPWRERRCLCSLGGGIGAMLGLSRLAYSLATNRQIPSAARAPAPDARSTPFVLIAIAAVLAAGLVVPADLDFLVGIYAFGALLAFTIAHLSVCVLRFREPERDRPYRIPLSITVRGGALPVPAVLGALGSAAAWSACSSSTGRATSGSAGWRPAWRSTSSTARARASRCSSG